MPAAVEMPPRVSRIPETRYARNGDVHIAWQAFGQGPPDIVFVAGFVSHVESQWDFPSLATFMQRLARLGRVIVFDKRGTGMSDRVATPATLEQRIDDLRAVMDAAGSQRAVLFGTSEGVPASLFFAATWPQRTLGLVAYGGSVCARPTTRGRRPTRSASASRSSRRPTGPRRSCRQARTATPAIRGSTCAR
jgi:pimeloyl-ACP methyl ester carboxylesterase